MKRRVKIIFDKLGIERNIYSDKGVVVYSPIDGLALARVDYDKYESLDKKIQISQKVFEHWRTVPGPKRGELLDKFAQLLIENKEELAELVCIECGKIMEEARGEVQEMIDICKFTIGLSRQMYGLTMPSERFDHKMQENWLPLGVVLTITAFNFPVAVWAWNLALAVCCGNSVIWKPSNKTPLTAIASQFLFDKACESFEFVPKYLSQLVIIENKDAEYFLKHKDVKLVSATGSTQMGRQIAPIVAANFKKSIYELGGNNASIITPSADMAITLPSVIFGAVGTCGQRCTTTRRLIVHTSIINEIKVSLVKAYKKINDKVGNPLEKESIVGPIIDKDAFENMQNKLEELRTEGYEVFGGDKLEGICKDGYYVKPALVFLDQNSEILDEETFAPILYVIPYESIEEAIKINNSVPQGLSSSIFSTDIREIEYFKTFSDCGITNVNIGTSGAEIGGAFGGEKETGGGRESGSDAWKQYMRRQTSTTYYGDDGPELAQGVEFGV
jgi:aldehyde dehydrogenase (NAD+)